MKESFSLTLRELRKLECGVLAGAVVTGVTICVLSSSTSSLTRHSFNGVPEGSSLNSDTGGEVGDFLCGFSFLGKSQ